MKETSIVFTGEAGTGIKTIEGLITKILVKEGLNTYLSKEIMSRIRGGNNTTQLRVSDEKVTAFSEKSNFIIVLSRNSLYRLNNRMDKDTIIIGPKAFIEETYVNNYKVNFVEFAEIARGIGSIMYANIVILGFVASIFDADENIAINLLKKKFDKKGQEVIDKNIEAYRTGVQLAKELNLKIEIKKNKEISNKAIINGTQATALGALAGGCNMVTSYPMAPSTGILMTISDLANDFDVAIEQAEDEIAAINMTLGGWYAGARTMTTTSGGGFALMGEAISMAGIGELPCVIQLAQRPGPGTGLPTRTEQGDLNLALYAGHGDFPRVLLAPGSLEEAITLGNHAFNVADKYQIPVIFLTDFHFLNQSYNLDNIDFSKLKVENHIVKSEKEYLRYKLTEDGISPRSVPAYGKGYVCVDSDEHDESGHITEDFDVRVAHNEKRNRKLNNLVDIEPKIFGNKNGKKLVVGWGSTYGAIKESINKLDDENIKYAHFTQIYPLPKSTKELLQNADELIIVENNFTGQFARLIKMELGIDFDETILKANGLPFTVEELMKSLGGIK